MHITFSSREIEATQYTLEKIGLSCINLDSLINEGSRNITLEDLNLPDLEDEFDGPIISYTIKHFVNVDGDDDTVHHLFINEDFIVDILELYTTSFKFGIDMIKDIYCKFRFLLEPKIKNFVGKWNQIKKLHDDDLGITDDDLEF